MRSRGDFSEDTQKQQDSRTVASDATLLLEQGTVVVADPHPGALESDALSQRVEDRPGMFAGGWHGWLAALRCVFPIYLATHLALLMLTYVAALFSIGNFSTKSLPLSTLGFSWYRWDSGHFTDIAIRGYTAAWHTAFFPSFPLLEHLLAYLTGNPFIAGLIISNVVGLLMLAVFYRLVLEDFDRAQAWNAVLYLAVFPTAFFFAAAYNESLFLLFTLLAFYYMRRSSWWLAGLFALLASLTRSAGICLALPFCYEYLRQHHFSLQKLRLDALACAGTPVGLGLFALYCYVRFHDLLAFSHAQAVWNRSMHGPWHGLIDAAVLMLHRAALSFDAIHNMIDLSVCLFILALVILAFIGPWKFSGAYRVYGLYAVLIYLFSLIFPISGGTPLGAFSRYMLEVFPAFIVLAAIGKKQQVNLYYLMLSIPLLTFLLLQFLTGHWVI
jgi:Gpi18-like mannosyltransferase